MFENNSEYSFKKRDKKSKTKKQYKATIQIKEYQSYESYS